MPLSALYENRLRRQWSKSEPDMHGLRMHSPANRPLRSGGGSSSRSVTPRSTASALPNTNGKAPAGREAPADVPSGATNAAEGAPAEKPKRKPKKKGWKGYAMVYYDDDGNVIEERLRDETLPAERSTISILPEARPSRANTAAMSDVVTGKRSRTSSTPQPDHSTLPSSSSIAPPPEAAAPEPTEPKKVDDIAAPKMRRKTSPGSTAQPEMSRTKSSVPRSSPAQPKAPRQSNRSTGTASTLAVAAGARERQRETASSRATPTHVVEDDAPLPKLLRAGMGEGPYPTPPESYLRSEAPSFS